MAGFDELSDKAIGLTMMSVDDFLQEKTPSPPTTAESTVLNKPIPVHFVWDSFQSRPRQVNENHKGYEAYEDDGSHGRKGGVRCPPMHPRKNRVRPGALLTHNPPSPQHLVTCKTVSSYRPSESVLTVGSRESQSVKERVSGGIGGEVEVDPEAVLPNALPQQEVSYILGQTLTLQGLKCHFLPVQDLAQVKRDTILKLLAGFLNTGERGVIYMGLSENGCVEGVTAKPQLIGEFVEGLMKTIKFYLMPKLHTPQYGVRYTNVVTTSGQIMNNVWIVELHTVPQMERYYNPLMDMSYYIRHDTHTKRLPFGDFCETVVAQASESFEPEIQRLQERISRLRQALETKGIDCSTAGSHLCNNCWLNDCPTQGFPNENKNFQGL